jgi:crotonobetainyl-CoA:carnitine CoA-transferase CaiB-like acyl-CoA transferase
MIVKTQGAGPLAGLRILELGHFVAAPFCARLLADLGAEVIKVEPPGGDPVRQWGRQVQGATPWWSMHGRNKHCVTLDLKQREAVDIVLKLAATSDAVVENFRPGQLKKFGLGDDVLQSVNPRLVIAHISGYGQSGPYRDRAAFGVIGEAIGGLRYLSDHAPGVSNLPPVRVGVSIGDSIAGLYAAFGIMAALWRRDQADGGPQGRILDVALTDSILSMMDGLLPEYGAFGDVRQPVGSRLANAAPSNAYPTSDGRWILIAANSDPLFAKLAILLGRPDLPLDMRFVNNPARCTNVEALDEIISGWTGARVAAESLNALNEADIPCTQIYTVADIASDAQFRHRGMVQNVNDERFCSVLQAGVVPHVENDPGAIRWPGPPVGAHTQDVLSQRLGYGAAEIEALRQKGVLG